MGSVRPSAACSSASPVSGGRGSVVVVVGAVVVVESVPVTGGAVVVVVVVGAVVVVVDDVEVSSMATSGGAHAPRARASATSPILIRIAPHPSISAGARGGSVPVGPDRILLD